MQWGGEGGSGRGMGRLWLLLTAMVVLLAWELAGEASRPQPNVSLWVLDHQGQQPPEKDSQKLRIPTQSYCKLGIG